MIFIDFDLYHKAFQFVGLSFDFCVVNAYVDPKFFGNNRRELQQSYVSSLLQNEKRFYKENSTDNHLGNST